MIRKPNPQAQAKVLVEAMRAAGVDLKLSAALDIVARQNGHKSWNVMAAAQKGQAKATTPRGPKASMLLTAKVARPRSAHDVALDGWSVGDVTSVRPDLYPSEALGVLQETVRRMDASIGINWDVLTNQADWMFPEHRVATLHAVGYGVNRMVELDLATGKLYHAPDAMEGAYALNLRNRDYLRSREKLELADDVELIYGDETVTVGALAEDSSAREDILRALGEPKLLGLAPSTHALACEMSLSLKGDAAALNAAGLFERLEATPVSQLPDDTDVETAAASGAAEALASFTLALAARGVEVWSSDFQAAFEETLDSLGNELT